MQPCQPDGVRSPADPHAFKDFVVDQLNALPGLAARAMFGGYGLYAGPKFFGIIHADRLYFKTSPETVGDYLAEDMSYFRTRSKRSLKSYYEVPARVLDRRSELLAWAQRAVAV